MVGTYDGRCIFYSTDQLKYHTTIHVRYVNMIALHTCKYKQVGKREKLQRT